MFFQISNQVQDIENGHLPKIHIDQALKDLEKRSKTCSEAWMKALTDLDSIQLDESQTLARSKRKSIVNSIAILWFSLSILYTELVISFWEKG